MMTVEILGVHLMKLCFVAGRLYLLFLMKLGSLHLSGVMTWAVNHWSAGPPGTVSTETSSFSSSVALITMFSILRGLGTVVLH